MSLPRPIHPGSSYLLTRRTTQRQFLLRPDDLTNQIVLYALAYAAMLTGVVVHAVVAMSNHIHLVVTDPEGRLPKFLHVLDRHIACCMNASLKRSENFWASDPPSVVALARDEDVLDKIAYVIANPTRAGLVEDPSEWPGVMTPLSGMRATVQRPSVFYRRNGKMPPSLELEVRVPRLDAYDGDEAVAARLRELLAEKLRAAKVELTEANRRFVGRDGVLSTSRSASASSPEPTRALRPRFAARDRKQQRIVLERLRAFYGHYARALHSWRAGDRNAVFPAGTYLMRVRHGVLVETAPA